MVLAVPPNTRQTPQVMRTLFLQPNRAFPGGRAYCIQQHPGPAEPPRVARPEAVGLARTKPAGSQGDAAQQREAESRQQATPNVFGRPSRATKSATGPWEDDPDLAAVIDAWDRRPGAVRAGIVAIVKKSSVER